MPIELPSQALLRELLDYDPETGLLRWRPRADRPSFNGAFAGKVAFTSKNSRGYHQGDIYGVNYLAHRVIWRWMTGNEPDTIDHINRNQADNRWANLRSVTQYENNLNRDPKVLARSGVLGVWYRKNVWRAVIKVRGRKIYFGSFKSLEEATAARRAAELKYRMREPTAEEQKSIIGEAA